MSAKRSSSSSADAASGNELVMTRTFDAPRTLVFAAYTERKHLERWQGAPEGMTVTVEQSDIRVGGRYRICMHAPDGAEHWLEGVYREVVPPERLVFTHTWLDARMQPTIETLVTITFVDRAGKTELTLRQTGLASPASRAGHEHGWGSTFNRLHDYLETLQ